MIQGAGLYPFAISIILFSLIVDKIGYGTSMIFAFVGHVAATIITVTATSFEMLYIGTFIYALANGVVEAVVNPVVATMSGKNKTHWLNVLHAGWPGGLVLGGLLSIGVLTGRKKFASAVAHPHLAMADGAHARADDPLRLGPAWTAVSRAGTRCGRRFLHDHAPRIWLGQQLYRVLFACGRHQSDLERGACSANQHRMAGRDRRRADGDLRDFRPCDGRPIFVFHVADHVPAGHDGIRAPTVGFQTSCKPS